MSQPHEHVCRICFQTMERRPIDQLAAALNIDDGYRALEAKLHAAEEREAKLGKVVEASKAVLSMCKRGPHAESANVFMLETYLSNLAGEG